MDFKPLITLLAIVNPLAIVPFFIHYTQGFSREQRIKTIWISSFSAFAVIATSALAGLKILEFFSISLASFQVGGGMLLLISSLNMLNAQPAESKPASHELEDGVAKAAMGASIAVVPLTIPLLTGPATMSTVVIYADRAKTFWQLATLVGFGAVVPGKKELSIGDRLGSNYGGFPGLIDEVRIVINEAGGSRAYLHAREDATPEQLAAVQRADFQKWEKPVKATGYQAD